METIKLGKRARRKREVRIGENFQQIKIKEKEAHTFPTVSKTVLTMLYGRHDSSLKSVIMV